MLVSEGGCMNSGSMIQGSCDGLDLRASWCYAPSGRLRLQSWSGGTKQSCTHRQHSNNGRTPSSWHNLLHQT